MNFMMKIALVVMSGQMAVGEGMEVRTVRTQKVRPAIQAESEVIEVTAPPQVVQAPVQAPQPIYIMQAPPTMQQPQMEPATVVETKSLREQKSEQIRKQREEIERQTEDKLLERLEDQRLLSEKERADKILGGDVPAAVGPVAPPPAQVYQEPLSTPYVAPAQTVIVAPQAIDTQVISAKTEDLDTEKKDSKTKFSVGALGGLGSYPSVGNVTGVYAAGLEMGIRFPEGLGLEFIGMYSTYDIQVNQGFQNPYIQNYNMYNPYSYGPYNTGGTVWTMKQVNLLIGADYQLLESRVTPVVGLLAGYTRRSYTSRVNLGYLPNNGEASGSGSFDGGFKFGVDVKATEKLTVGANVRYLLNISNRTDDPYAYMGRYGTPVEELNYYLATVNLRLSF